MSHCWLLQRNISHAGLQNLYIMLKYCLNEVQCRRSVIAKCFGEQWKPEDCNNHCDICQRLNGCSSTNYTAGKLESGSGSRYITIDENISGHCQLLVEIVEEAHHKQQRLTALKVIETWRKKLKTITRSKSNAHGERTYDSEAERERILLHAIVEGVLKEEFHFTPYSTISYIGIGRKAAGIRRGTVTMTLQRLVAQTTQSVSSASVSSHKEGLYSEAISDCATLEQSARKRSLSESPADDSVQTSSKKRLKSVKQQRDVKRNECCKTKKVGEKSRTASDDVVTIEID